MMDCTLRELQLVELAILKEFDRICKKHNITYYLAYGTLIGAARHKGFIPWDDDIDIMVAYQDYEKLREVCKTEMGEEYYYQSRSGNPQNFIFWDRIGLRNTTSIDLSLKDIKADWGICIDIFPLFLISSDPEEQRIQEAKFRKSQIYNLKYLNRHLAKEAHGMEKLKKLISGYIPDKLNVKAAEKLLHEIALDSDHAKEYCFDYSMLNECGLYRQEWFSSTTELEFEGMMFPVPAGYDALLHHIYGDYMKIPAEDERINHSDNEHVKISLHQSYLDFL